MGKLMDKFQKDLKVDLKIHPEYMSIGVITAWLTIERIEGNRI